MERHHRGLTDAVDIEHQQHRDHRARDLAGQDAAVGEVQRAGGHVGPHDGKEQEPDRGAEQDAEIDPRAAFGLVRLVMRDQGIGRHTEYFVGGEQGQHVAGHRHAERAEQRDCEEGVEAGLVAFRDGRACSQSRRSW